MINTALIIPIYNRPQYLKRCFESLSAAMLPQLIILIDDASTDIETIQMVQSFKCEADVIKITNATNKGVQQNLLKGYDMAFALGFRYVANLDSDAIVKPDFYFKIARLKHDFPHHIASGFNCDNPKNPILENEKDYVLRQHCNGINMLIDADDYKEVVRPALLQKGNWDFNSTHKLPFIITKPSVVQHIGMESSMGHTEHPDVACDFFNLSLPDVTLLGIDWKNPAGIKKAAEISQQDIEFGSVQILTDIPIDGREAYSRWCIQEMWRYIPTSHVLVIHADGYVLNWKAWDDDWLQYDYIGATWAYKDNKNVGNGGFSLRSKKLQLILAEDKTITAFHPEDHIICRTYREHLEKTHDIKFAPEEVANRFSIEAYGSHVFEDGNAYNGQFGFHGKGVNFKDPALTPDFYVDALRNAQQQIANRSVPRPQYAQPRRPR